MKLVVLAATLPAYRKDFFELLNSELVRKDVDMTVLHGTSFFNKAMKFDDNPGYKAMPLETIQFKFFGFDISWWKGIFKKIKELNPDMVIMHPGPGNISLWFIFIYLYLKRIPIGEWGSGYVRPEISGFKIWLRTTIKSFFLKKVRFILTYGSKWKNELTEKGYDGSRIFVTQNTIFVEKILDLEVRHETKSTGTLEFLFVGALIRQKNLNLAIKAITRLVREGYDIKYTIVGKGEIIDELRKQVKDEGMSERIFLTGPKYDKELTSYFINSDVFLLPGTGGLAINEAMAYALPVLSTVGDGTVTDLLYDGVNGFYIDDKPTEENIYQVCRKLLSLDRAELVKMGNRSKEIIAEKATLHHMVEAFESGIFLDSARRGAKRIPIFLKKK